MSTVLVVTPHCDDETLGMGGTIAKHAMNGDSVTVLELSTHADKNRHLEFAKAMDILGCDWISHEEHFVTIPDTKLAEYMPEMISIIDSASSILKPDYLYIPYPSVHQDHVAAYEAGIRSSRISLNKNHHFVRNVLVYTEPVSEMDIHPTGLTPNYFVDISGAPLELKVNAIKAYRSQNLPPPNPSNEEFIRAEAVTQGGRSNMEAAEVFCVIRMNR